MRVFRVIVVGMLAILATGMQSEPASASGGCPTGSVYARCQAGWEITSHSLPTDLPPGGKGLVELRLFNVGAASTENGAPITVTDKLPEGVTAIDAGSVSLNKSFEAPPWLCTGVETSLVRCSSNPLGANTAFPGGASPLAEGVSNEYYDITWPIEIEVAVAGPPRNAVNEATVAGGGASDAASTSSLLRVDSAPARFGISNWDVWASNADGTLDTQAGSHPYAVTFDFELNSALFENAFAHLERTFDAEPAGEEMREVTTDLPPGLIGDPAAVPQCPRKVFDEINASGEPHCPPGTVIGFVNLISKATGFGGPIPIYNVVPPHGVAAQFGFDLLGTDSFLDAGVRTGGDYGIVVHDDNIVRQRGTLGAVITLWGVPGDASHDSSRCDEESLVRECSAAAGTAPLFTMPSACEAQVPFTVHASSWEAPEAPSTTVEKTVLMHDSNGSTVGVGGCEHLGFGTSGPSIAVKPDTRRTDSPAGVTVEVRPQLGGLEEATGLSTSDIQNTTVTLPRGLVLDPAQAAGLEACKPGDVPGGDDLPLAGENGEEERFTGPADCPLHSKVGTVVMKSPLIEGTAEKQFEGNVYVLESDPPEVKLLLTASADGINVKLVGTVHLNEQTGQLTTTFLGTPELPFTVFKLSFNGGAQAALQTPMLCGLYGAAQGFAADFGPWASPFVPDVFPTAEFALGEGSGGSACPSNPPPFAPQMIAGATTDQAGGYTDFSMLLNRGDGQQRISTLQFKVPTGLLGMISHVTLCEEPQASRGECPADSQIGHTIVGAGAGPFPLYIPEAGKSPTPIYVTGPYRGAPYGLAIVVPVQAGPFNLGTVVQRARIEVDPQTARLTITTNPLIQSLKGVPADLRTINAIIDRPQFMFNPTNCDPQSFSGTATSIEGARASLSSPFQVGSCRSLQFKPTFRVSTTAKTSRIDGASLHVALKLPDEGGLSSEANIQRVKVSLPKALPTPLKTLQKACTERTFEEAPENCPPASQVGQVRVTTPVLPGGLSGTAYFVSHGGAKYPELIFVLVGQNGVTVQVHGETQISKQGITTATFATIPDVPFSGFELTLPQRQFPALTANGNLCRAQAAGKLTMPTELAGQNGLVIKQSTKITVDGCPEEGREKAVHRGKRRKGRGKR